MKRRLLATLASAALVAILGCPGSDSTSTETSEETSIIDQEATMDFQAYAAAQPDELPAPVYENNPQIFESALLLGESEVTDAIDE